MIFLVQSSKFTLLTLIFFFISCLITILISLCSYMTCIAHIFKKMTKNTNINWNTWIFKIEIDPVFLSEQLVCTFGLNWVPLIQYVEEQDLTVYPNKMFFMCFWQSWVSMRELIVKKLEEDSIGPYTRTHSYASEVFLGKVGLMERLG